MPSTDTLFFQIIITGTLIEWASSVLNQVCPLLQVPGVAENRPSVLKGDHLLATLADEQTHNPVVQYKGYVHAVELEQVKLGFCEK